MVGLLLFALGCSKDRFTYSKRAVFDELHESVSKYSASISSRNTNWDSLKTAYRPRISEDMTEAAFFGQISALLQTFRDPHVWLCSPTDSMYTIDHLAYNRNYDASVVRRYLAELEVHTAQIHSAYIDDCIGYLFCADFRGDQAIVNDIYASVLNKFSDTKGLIIDLRVNDGGNVYNAQKLLNKLTDRRLRWHRTQNRTQEGFDDAYEWFMEPDKTLYYAQPVVVLTGRYTISAGERFAMGAKLLDNIVIIGDTTANTQGSVMGREMLNGWTYTMTFERCTDPDGFNYAGTGIPPDEYVDYDMLSTGNNDPVLERAVEWLK